MRFDKWIPFVNSQYDDDYKFESMRYIFSNTVCKAGWKPSNWLPKNLTGSCLSPAQTAPLTLEDTFRCRSLLAQAKGMVSYYKAKRIFLILGAWNAYAQDVHELNVRRNMWLLRSDYMEQRLQAAELLFPPHVVQAWLNERRITLAKALHPRVVSLGACQLSRLDAALVAHITALSVGA